MHLLPELVVRIMHDFYFRVVSVHCYSLSCRIQCYTTARGYSVVAGCGVAFHSLKSCSVAGLEVPEDRHKNNKWLVFLMRGF